jgi:D-alanine-D-alanine ligase
MIFVLGGGKSTERDVSLRSSAEVLKSVEALGYKAKFIDTKTSDEYLNATSQDIVLPILHGKYGEDGTLQRELEKQGIPFLGSGSEASKNCFDKWVTRNILLSHNIPMPGGDLIGENQYKNHKLFAKPHVLKDLEGGSSIGTYIVRDQENIDWNVILEAFSGKKLLIEELIVGHEITVPILDETALPVIEIIPPVDGEFDYENKYNGKTQELCPPFNVNKTLQEQAMELATRVHNIMACRHFSRVDIMIDEQNKLYVLEINTIPGLTSQSLFPMSAKSAGMSMDALVEKLIGYVARDYQVNLELSKV